MVNPYRFYTYAYLREDGTPYYIGKGEGRRAYKKRKGEIGKPTDKTRIIFLKQNLTEEEAFRHEIYMIFVFGRKDLGTGILRNRTNGGEGGSGIIRSEETRKKLSETKRGKNNPFYGKKGETHPRYGTHHSEESRKKMSGSKSGENNPNYNKIGKNSPNYGREHTEESRKKMSEALKGEKHPLYGKSHSKKTKRKMSESMSGENNPRYGVHHSEESKKKMSESKSGKNHPAYGKNWWNDGCGNTKLSKECPGEGWEIGRGKRN